MVSAPPRPKPNKTAKAARHRRRTRSFWWRFLDVVDSFDDDEEDFYGFRST